MTSKQQKLLARYLNPMNMEKIAEMAIKVGDLIEKDM